MFIGHFGVGFAAKRVVPRVSLGTAFLAAQWLDLLWPTFLLLGMESVRIAPGATAVTPLIFDHYPIRTACWRSSVGAWRLALRTRTRTPRETSAARPSLPPWWSAVGCSTPSSMCPTCP